MKRIAFVVLVAGVVALATFFRATAQREPSPAVEDTNFSAAKQTFESNCASCHGPGGAGGDRAPALYDNPDLRKLAAPEIENIIKQGTPRGMPAFPTLRASDV